MAICSYRTILNHKNQLLINKSLSSPFQAYHKSLGVLSPWYSDVSVPYHTPSSAHVGLEEVCQRGGAAGPVEGEAHGAPVRVLAVADAAVRSRVVARSYQVLFYLEIYWQYLSINLIYMQSMNTVKGGDII